MRLITKLRTASLLNTIWHHPSLLTGRGADYEQSFERLLHRLEYDPTEFQRHPRGANRWPDFHLHLDDHTLAIELKTTQRNTVCMGGTWPHTDCIYIIGHTSTVRTLYMSSKGVADSQRITVVRGADLVTKEERRQYDTHRAALQRMNHIQTESLSLQVRTNVWIKLAMERREEWFHNVLQWVMTKP